MPADDEDDRFEEVLRAVARAPSAPVATRFAGTERYRDVKRIGTGGFGDVYEATDARSGEAVALKVLRRATPELLRRFEREFHALAGVTHRNLVRLNDLTVEGDHWVLSMELVRGQPFLEFVSGALDRLRDATAQLAEGLTALHAAQKLHRDIKPSNVLVEPGGRVVLLDFGLVKDLSMAQSTARVGTPHYMSPEQCAEERLGTPSDWYAVGVMLYETLTGRRPFEGSTVQIVLKKQTTDPERPREVNVSVPEDLDALAMDLLSRDPAKRPEGPEVVARVRR